MSQSETDVLLNWRSNQSDVSLSGFGFVNGTHVYGGSWSSQELDAYGHNINALEVLAIWHGLTKLESDVTGKRVLVRCDNTTAMYYINNMGSQKIFLMQ